MTLRFVEGWDWISGGSISSILSAAEYYFEILSATQNVVNPAISTNTAFSFGKSLRYSGAYSQFTPTPQLVYPVPARDEGYIGARVYVGHTHEGYTGPTFFDSQGGAQVTVQCGQYGIIRVWRGQPYYGTLLATSAPGAFYADEWFYLEVYAKLDNSAGEVEVRVNTETVISLVSSDTIATSRSVFDMIGLRGRSTTNATVAEDQYFDDMYYCDTDGSVNNGFLGNVRVKTQFAIADGSHIDFVIGGSSPAATNWQSVQNSALDQTKFVYSPDSGDYDLYEMNPIVNAPYVHGIQVRSSMWQDDATQRIGRNILKTPLGTIDEGVDVYLNQTPSLYRDIFELNPDTGVFYTGTEANGCEAGVKVES